MKRLTEIHGLLRRKLGELKVDKLPDDDSNDLLQFIADKGMVYKSTYVVGDQRASDFNEGKRHLALSIIRFIAKDPSRVERLINQTIVTMENRDEN